jgi:hypothetical protein
MYRVPLSAAVNSRSALASVRRTRRTVIEILDRNARLDVRDRTADVGIDEMQDLGYGRREIHHAQFIVQKHGCDLGALQEVLEIAGGAGQLVHAVSKLAIDGSQLLIDRLQFLARGLQLLVGRLQLFIERLIFLVGRLQLLVRALKLLDRCLQALARGTQLAFEMLDVFSPHQGIRAAFLISRMASRTILEKDNQIAMADRRIENRLDGDIDQNAVAIHPELHMFHMSCLAGFQRAAQHGTQLEPKVAMNQAKKVETCGPRCRLDIAAGASGKMQDLEIFVRNHVSGSVAFGNTMRSPLEADIGPDRNRPDFRRATACACRDRKFRRQTCAGFKPLENSGASVDGHEQLRMPRHVFRITEKKKTLRQQGEMKERNDAVLQFGV